MGNIDGAGVDANPFEGLNSTLILENTGGVDPCYLWAKPFVFFHGVTGAPDALFVVRLLREPRSLTVLCEFLEDLVPNHRRHMLGQSGQIVALANGLGYGCGILREDVRVP